MASGQGSPDNPVQLDPFQLIVDVHWDSGPAQHFNWRHVKFRSGPTVALGSFNNTVYPPTGVPTSEGPDPGFSYEGTGAVIKGSSEAISLSGSDDSGTHCVTWALFYEPNPEPGHELPTDNQFAGYGGGVFEGSSFDSVLAEYNDHGELTAATPHPR